MSRLVTGSASSLTLAGRKRDVNEQTASSLALAAIQGQEDEVQPKEQPEQDRASEQGIHPSKWNERHRTAIQDVIRYVIFLVLFTIGNVRGLTDSRIYYFGAHIRSQMAEVEFLKKHSPTFGKTFEDIGTVQEVYQWMLGPLHGAAFDPSATWDGSDEIYPRYSADGRKVGSSKLGAGIMLGHGQILGPVRISQVRQTLADNCSSVPVELNYTDFRCYTGESRTSFGMFGDWDVRGCKDDDTWAQCTVPAKPGQIRPKAEYTYWRSANWTKRYDELVTRGQMTFDPQPFIFGGRNGWNGEAIKMGESALDAKRAEPYSSYRDAKTTFSYPYSGFAVMIHPKHGPEVAKRTLQNLVLSQYITPETKAMFVDFTVYNPMIDYFCGVRMSLQMTEAGGVIPSHQVKVARLYEFVTTEDTLFWVFVYVPVLLFYLYYMRREYHIFKDVGTRAYFSSLLSIVQMLNFIFYWTQLFCRLFLLMYLPSTFDITSDEYIDFRRAIEFKSIAIALQATNVFLNWFKLIQILSFSPSFGVMTKTLGRAAKGVAGFSLIFFIISFGFAQSHSMVFGAHIEEFRTITQTIYSLFQSLLGDFDFVALQHAHSTMGPVLFIIFVVLAVFVVLNMLIAIISDAYAECEEEMQGETPVNLTRDVIAYLAYVSKLEKLCCCNARTRIGPEAGATRGKTDDYMDGEDSGAGNDSGVGPARNAAQNNLVLLEWYDSLKQSEAEMEHLQVQLKSVRGEVEQMKREFHDGLDKMTALVLRDASHASL